MNAKTREALIALTKEIDNMGRYLRHPELSKKESTKFDVGDQWRLGNATKGLRDALESDETIV
jgi:hypothetical protein